MTVAWIGVQGPAAKRLGEHRAAFLRNHTKAYGSQLMGRPGIFSWVQPQRTVIEVHPGVEDLDVAVAARVTLNGRDVGVEVLRGMWQPGPAGVVGS